MTLPSILKVLSVSPLDANRLHIKLSNGKSGAFDVSPYFQGEFFSELRDVKYFSRVSLVAGKSGIEWPNGQDLSAYTLESGLRAAKKVAATKRASRANPKTASSDSLSPPKIPSPKKRTY